ncbi:MAG TPA: hypothetical protein H9783_05325 [Candidatus Limosilactobacillus faecipullorum]|nr:hypothetical protein [Candidatus Limosilactobacillus faecipullorum]
MVKKSQRFIQPHSAKEAMLLIQKLFNQYRNAPLTQELLNYHLNLLQRLQGDIKAVAIKENNPKQLSDLEEMTRLMQSWSGIRFAGKPFPGKLRHFHLATSPQQHFKRQVHKMNGNHRASHH